MYIIIKNKINGGKCLFEGDKVSLNLEYWWFGYMSENGFV